MNKKSICIVCLGALVLLTLFLIYPTVPHQRLYDSPDFHVESSLLIKDGRAIWNLNPLSIFGVYPISASGLIGSVYFLSSTSLLTGIHIEQSILSMNYGISILMCLSGFLLGRKLFDNNVIGLFTSFFIVSARISITYLEWTATPRGFVGGFLPFVFLLMFSIFQKESLSYKRDIKYLTLFMLVLIVMLATHRLMIFVLPAIALFFVYQRYQVKIKDAFTKFRDTLYVTDRSYSYFKLFLIFMIFYITVIISIALISNFLLNPDFLKKTLILKTNNPFLQPINLFYYISRKFGIGMILATLGFIALSLHTKKKLVFFLFLAILSLIPFSVQESYVYPIWALYLSLLAGYGLFYFITRVGKKSMLSVTLSSLILISIVIAPSFVTLTEPHQIFRKRTTHVTDQEIETAMLIPTFVDYNQSFFVDPDFSSSRLSAYSNRCSLGLRGIEQVWVNDTIQEGFVISFVFQTDITYSFESFYREKGQLFYIENDVVLPERTETRGWSDRTHQIILINNYTGANYKRIINAYQINLFIIDEDFIGEKNYLNELRNEEYLLYTNGRYSFYPVSY